MFRALHFRDCYPLLPFLLLGPPSRPIPHSPLPPLPFILRSVVDASRCPRGVGGRLVDRPPFNGRPRPRNDGVLRVTRCLRFRAPIFARGSEQGLRQTSRRTISFALRTVCVARTDSNYLLLGDACPVLGANDLSGADKWLITISLTYTSLLDTDKALLCAYYNFLYSDDFF